MKLQLDTTAKTVKIESDIKLSLLIKTLKAMLPIDWKDFTLQTNTVIQHWKNPIVWPIVQPYIEPYHQPWYFTCNMSNGTTNDNNLMSNNFKEYTNSLKAGIYNIEL